MFPEIIYKLQPTNQTKTNIKYEFNFLFLFLSFSSIATVTKFIRIGIADKNDNPPYFDKALYEAEVDENEDIQHTVLTVTAKDHDECELYDGFLPFHFIPYETDSDETKYLQMWLLRRIRIICIQPFPFFYFYRPI